MDKDLEGLMWLLASVSRAANVSPRAVLTAEPVLLPDAFMLGQ